MASVTLTALRKDYAGNAVIHGIDCAIEDGEFIVIVGPSGCGKSTLLRMIAGLEAVSSGELRIGERVVNKVEPKDRDIAMVFQNYALYPHMSVFDNMAYGLRIRGLDAAEIRARVDKAAGILQLEKLLERKPRQLSGGQRQRVAMGRAIVRQPKCFLFDEPLSNLDAKLRTEMRLEIKKLHTQLRNTVVYVTHDQVEAMTMATKIAVMNKGVIQQVGSPDEIYDFPENVFVADFIGSPAMNMIDGVISKADCATTMVSERAGLTFDLTDYDWRQPAEDGQKVKVGFRPEHFAEIGDAPQGRTIKMDLPVQFVEKVGPDAIAFLALPEQTIAVRVDSHAADRYRRESKASVLLPLQKVNVFDADTGRRM